MGIGHENESHSVKLQPIRAETALGTTPYMAVSNATFTYVRNGVVLRFFINEDEIEGF